MTCNFNGSYINVLEVKYTMSSTGEDPNYPYSLRVYFKDGSSIGTEYKREKDRDEKAACIAAKMDAAFLEKYPTPLTPFQVKLIAAAEVEKVRRDIRTLRKMLGGSK